MLSPSTRELYLWHPRSVDETEVWMVTFYDEMEPPEVARAFRRISQLRHGPAGLYSQDEGAVSAGIYHPSLPPSMQAVITGNSTNASSSPVKVDAPVKESRTLDYIVDGAVRLDLQIRPAL